jgi:dienelactone hydrolase
MSSWATPHPNSRRRWPYARFDDEHGLADIGAAIAAQRAMPEVVGGIGTIGFCLGGRLVVKTAARHKVACAVSYYRVGIEDCLDLVDDIRCPMVLHFAELDSFNPPATVERIRRGFATSKNMRINVYAGVDHAFASPGAPVLRQARRDDGVFAIAGAFPQGAGARIRPVCTVGQASRLRIRVTRP